MVVEDRKSAGSTEFLVRERKLMMGGKKIGKKRGRKRF